MKEATARLHALTSHVSRRSLDRQAFSIEFSMGVQVPGPTPPTSASTEITSRGEPPLEPPGTRAIPAHPLPTLPAPTGIPPFLTRYGCPSWPSGSPSAWSSFLTFLTFDLELGGADDARRSERAPRGTTYPRDPYDIWARLRARARPQACLRAHCSRLLPLCACGVCGGRRGADS